MTRPRRFEAHRYLGTRDDMVVYDCDDAEQASVIEARLRGEGLLDRNLVQTFAPDTLPEARNRGFRPH